MIGFRIQMGSKTSYACGSSKVKKLELRGKSVLRLESESCAREKPAIRWRGPPEPFHTLAGGGSALSGMLQ